jgi:hypothetical protein
MVMACVAALALSSCAQDEPLGQWRDAVIIDAGDYPTIQAALDAAAVDDVVQVPAGDFTENLSVEPGVILLGAGMDRTVLRGRIMLESGGSHVISGFRITREGARLSTPSAGIAKDCVGRGPSTIITRNQIDGFGVGIALAECPGTEITRNRIVRNQRGMQLSDLGGPVTDNLVLYNQRAGVVINSCGVTFAHNTLVGNGFTEAVADGGAAVVSIASNIDHVHNNIVVSNNAGLNLLEVANPNFSQNLVWGNSVNYAGHAVAHSADLSVDPRFVAAATDDFRLRAGSPAIDAGSEDACTEVDFDGQWRPRGSGPDMGAFEFCAPEASVHLVVSEVMANPVDEDRGEFVEIYNASDTPFDLAGARVTDGDATDVIIALGGGSTSVAAHAYAVIIDPEYGSGYDIPVGTTVVTVSNTTIGNGLSTTDPVTLYASDGVTILATFAHPFDSGNGVSAERLDLDGADLETNWRASPCTQSAGRPNCAPVTLASGLIISEVMSNPVDESHGEFIELYNGTEGPINAGTMRISDGDGTDVIVGWAGGETVVPARTYAVILDPDWPAEHMVFVDPSAVLLSVADSALGNGLAVDDPITLMSATSEVVDTYTRALRVADGRSVEKVSLSTGDLRDNWAQSSCELGSSPGYLNCVSSASSGPRLPLVMTEVMANPLDEDTGEFIELYNRGIDPVDAEGLILSDGDAVDTISSYRGGSTVIPAGGYAVVVDSEYADDYDMPPGTVLLSTPDSTLGSSLGLTDPVRLLATNGIEVIDTYRFPFNPGNGVSAERIDVRGFDSADNWTASTCETRSSPGAHNCAASETGLPKQIRVTEVMANQEGTETGGGGEFIELINVGERSVDLAGMWLTIGAEGATARDQIIAFEGGSSIIVPGAYALIIDPQYDDRYDITPGTVVVTIDDNNFGSSGMATTHWATLYDIDGITLLDRFRHPSDPGDGVSLYRVSIATADSAENWAATPCGATPGAGSCPDSHDVTSFTSFWVDRYGDESGIYWFQAIGWPEWHDPVCEFLIVCDSARNEYHYRDNIPAPSAFAFRNPYPDYRVVFVERSGPTDDCGGAAGECTAARFIVAPGAMATVPASSLGYYFARTDGPSLNTLDWFGGDPDLYWSIPPDGVLAPFTVEVPLP